MLCAMKIAINALFWIPGGTGGSETYLLELLRRWHDAGADEVVVFAGPGGNKQLQRFTKWRHVAVPYDEDNPFARLRAEQLTLPGLLNAEKFDVIFSPGNFLPVRARAPQVVSVMDLQDRHFPQYFSWKRRAARRVLFSLSAKRADRVIAISQATRQDLIALMQVPPKKVTAIHLGVDHSLADIEPAQVEAVRARYKLPERFCYLPAKTFPHKNHLVLLDALALLRDRNLIVPLVLTGGADVAHEAVLTRINRNGLQGQVRHLGFIDFNEIGPMYHAAALLAFPSSFEGFGLPVLEAMVCGCPVVTSDKMSLAELVHDAALVVEPTDVDELAGAIARLWTDEALRTEMIARGRARAAEFTWDKCAALTHAVLTEAARA